MPGIVNRMGYMGARTSRSRTLRAHRRSSEGAGVVRVIGCELVMRTAWLALAGGIALAGCGSSSAGETIRAPFTDHFGRERLGPDWRATDPEAYSIVRGQLRAQGARNHPLWLRKRLPRNVRVEFTVRSESAAGDIKVEIFGDGRSYATEDSYTATSYVVIFGGWHNSLSAIARMNEHGDDRETRASPRVVPGRTYAFRIERRGKTLTWWVDGERMLAMEDAEPLEGSGHDAFAFNNWESEVFFDDLVVTPL